MVSVNFITWNMEWMNDLFTAGSGAAQFRADDTVPQHSPDTTVRERRNHLSGALNEFAPDVVVVVEGPSTRDELKLFFDTDVQGTWDVELQATSGSAQNIGIAVRTDSGKFVAPSLERFNTSTDRSFDAFLLDTDDDDIKEQYRYERRPLYVEVRPQGDAPFVCSVSI